MTLRLLKLFGLALFWMMAAAGVLGAVGLLLGWSVAPPVAAISPLLIVIVILAISTIARNIRIRRGQFVLTYLEQAVRLNLPLSRFLLAAARSESGPLSMRLMQLRESIVSGASISTAMQQSVPEMPARTIQLTSAAEHLGRLPLVLARLVDENRGASHHYKPSMAGAYLLMMLLVVGGIVSLTSYYLFPKYLDIFHDFGTQIPEISRMVFGIGPDFQTAAAVVLILAVLAYFGQKIWEAIHGGQARFPLILALRLRLIDYTPLLGAIARQRGLGDVCELLADAIEVGRPAHAALEEASQLTLVPSIQQKIARWELAASEGLPLHVAAQRAGMPELVTGMLASASSNPAEALHFLSRYYSNRFSRTVFLLRGAAQPAAVLFVAFLVAIVALALFAPLVALIQTVGSSTSYHGRL